MYMVSNKICVVKRVQKVLMVLALMKRSPEENREDGQRLFEMLDQIYYL